MTSGPVRRAQLIAPFGIGSMVVMSDGTSVIVGGLDHWYKREYGQLDKINLENFVIEEWRLETYLGVDHFKEPPDYRDGQNASPDEDNLKLVVPCLRFPRWHMCDNCYQLTKIDFHLKGRIKCRNCVAKGRRKQTLVQVPFVAICKHGHLQDFPWREWVHHSSRPDCGGQMSLRATGGSTLGAQRVKCECGKSRSLSGITNFKPGFERTDLSDHLEPGEGYFSCQGASPWLGVGEGEGASCDSPLKGSLRNAANVYFALTAASIYIPQEGTEEVPEELIEVINTGHANQMIRAFATAQLPVNAETLQAEDDRLQDYGIDQIKQAIDLRDSTKKKKSGGPREVEGDDQMTAYRRPEYTTLLEGKKITDLFAEESPVEAFGQVLEKPMGDIFSKVMLIHKLRETRAFAGFSRYRMPDELLEIDDRDSLLCRGSPQTWLPAYVVRGEGILFQFREELIREWEGRDRVKRRIDQLQTFNAIACERRGSKVDVLSPRYLLIHTFSHLLINQLIFECGYSAAALRERLYVSADKDHPMAGLLVYTAAGDADGTLGGLVRMGQPGNLEKVINRALERAQWCSADPVCMEFGSSIGQGPDNCNLAACHGCAVLPETSCDKFNKFLDRGVVVGDPADPGSAIGFFTPENLGS